MKEDYALSAKIGIIAALSSEAKCFAKIDIDPDSYRIISEDSFLHYAGMGAKNAMRAAQSLIDTDVDALVSWGSAGALHPALVPGDIVLPVAVIDYSDKRQYQVDQRWHTALKNKLGHKKIYDGNLASTREVQQGPRQKIKLHRATGALAVDMESAAIAAVASKEKKPFLVIRSISDTAAMHIPKSAIDASDQYGRVSMRGLSVALMKRPREVLHYPRFIRSFASAKQSLREIVELCGFDLCFHEVL